MTDKQIEDMLNALGEEYKREEAEIKVSARTGTPGGKTRSEFDSVFSVEEEIDRIASAFGKQNKFGLTQINDLNVAVLREKSFSAQMLCGVINLVRDKQALKRAGDQGITKKEDKKAILAELSHTNNNATKRILHLLAIKGFVVWDSVRKTAKAAYIVNKQLREAYMKNREYFKLVQAYTNGKFAAHELEAKLVYNSLVEEAKGQTGNNVWIGKNPIPMAAIEKLARAKGRQSPKALPKPKLEIDENILADLL